MQHERSFFLLTAVGTLKGYPPKFLRKRKANTKEVQGFSRAKANEMKGRKSQIVFFVCFFI